MRWALFTLVTLLGLGAYAFVTWLLGVPDPGLQCDPQDLFASQAEHAWRYGHWMRTGFAIAAVGAAFGVWLANYLQLFHRFAGRAAWLLASLLALAPWSLAGAIWLSKGKAWAAQQTPSCLEEALAVDAAAQRVSLLGDQLGSARWQGFVYADMAVLMVLAGLVGLSLYLLVRRVRVH